MRCNFTLASGKRCSRRAAPGSANCRRHQAAPDPTPPPNFYGETLARDEQHALTAAAQLERMDAEIPALRLLIRQLMAANQLDAARRAIESLSRILRAREAQGESHSRLATWLDQALDDLEPEDRARLGQPLFPEPRQN